MAGIGAALNTAQVRPGDSVAVFGCGGVGLSVVQGAKLCNALPIVAVDVRAEKEAEARRFGATHFVDASAGDAVEAVRDITGGGADFTFEATGQTEIAELATRRPAGPEPPCSSASRPRMPWRASRPTGSPRTKTA